MQNQILFIKNHCLSKPQLGVSEGVRLREGEGEAEKLGEGEGEGVRVGVGLG